MRPSSVLALAALWLASIAVPAATAKQPTTADEILECLQHTRPLTHTRREIELVRRDRVGGERIQRAKIYGGVSREGFPHCRMASWCGLATSSSCTSVAQP